MAVVAAVDDHPLDPGGWFRSITEQTVAADAYEVIVIDGHGMTSWKTAYEDLDLSPGSDPRVTYEQIGSGGRARSINAALEAATGSLILFLADDFVPHADLVEQHLRFHRLHPEPEAVGIGRALVPAAYRGTAFVEWLERSGRLFGVPLDEETQSIPDDFFYVGNASVKRSLVAAAGRFDEDFPYHCWDDYEYGLRLRGRDMRSALIPGATVLHEHRITLAERRRQMRESGESAAIAERKDPGPHPWLARGDVPVWRWRAAAWKWRLLHFVTRKARYRELFYERTLDAAYATGLKHGRSRS